MQTTHPRHPGCHRLSQAEILPFEPVRFVAVAPSLAWVSSRVLALCQPFDVTPAEHVGDVAFVSYVAHRAMREKRSGTNFPNHY